MYFYFYVILEEIISGPVKCVTDDLEDQLQAWKIIDFKQLFTK